jgi:hypothetical protein
VRLEQDNEPPARVAAARGLDVDRYLARVVRVVVHDRHNPRGPGRVIAFVLLISLFGAACNSTNHLAQDAEDDITDPFEPDLDGDPTTTDDPTATDEVGPGDQPGPGGATPTPTGGVGVVPATPVPGGGVVRMGRGVTPTTIKIGFNHAAPLGPAYRAVGFGGSAEGTDERPIAEALVRYLNKNGGIAGRKIIPSFFEYDAVTGGTWDSLAAAACDQFNNDEKVFAVISGHVGQTDSLLDCLAKGGTPLVTQNQWPYDAKYYRDYKNFIYQPGRMRPERWMPQYIDGLADSGFFGSGYKLGVLRFDAPVFDRIKVLMMRELGARKLTVTHEAVISTPQSVGDFGQMGAQLQNAILQFQSRGVNRVIFNEWASQIPFFFTTQAEEQGFRPRYGFTSVNLPGTVEQQADKAQLQGAVAVSWLPAQDVHTEKQEPRQGASEIIRKCLKWVNDNGYKSASRLYVGTYCDSLYFLQQALSKTNDITPEGLWNASPKLGTSYASPYTWKTRFSLGRTDGASHVRLAKYSNTPCDDPELGCFQYAGALRPAG